MQLRGIILIVWFVCVSGFYAVGQDAAFSQFYANPMYLNPAFAGNTECGRLNLNYRNQWPSVSNAYVTYSLAYDQSLAAINSGYGVMFMNDQQGDGAYNRTAINAFYSYQLRLTSGTNLSFGVRGAYYQEKLSWEKLIFADQIDIDNGIIHNNSNEPKPENNQVSAVDFGAGLLFGYEDAFFAGVAADHLTQPQLGFYETESIPLDLKLTVHAGAVINLTQGGFGNYDQDDLTVQPNLMFVNQGIFSQLNAGLYVNMYPFVFGGWFRHAFENIDAAMLLVGINYNNFRIGYSYDFTLSQIGANTGGAHEISLAWDFCILKSPKKRMIRTINAPGF
ncbi:MAG: PorP/SprF family type IX secretion system membrane protein [Bacteroidales bacterium]|nr:PorP/SprF family type IX secretion system membrane protein [Bacteroidales bacterium]HOI32889.1 PorP/SprF family type IX secretion system membrane protein [Bacteroidales bacterium]